MSKSDKIAQKQTLIQLAIREQLMSYYKDISSNRLVGSVSGIRLREVPAPTQYRYERQLRSMRRPMKLSVAGLSLAELYKSPSEFKVLINPNYNEEAAWLVGGVTKSMADYLPGVTVKLPEDDGERGEPWGILDAVDINLSIDVQQEGQGYPQYAYSPGGNYVWSEYTSGPFEVGVDAAVEETTPQEPIRLTRERFAQEAVNSTAQISDEEILRAMELMNRTRVVRDTPINPERPF